MSVVTLAKLNKLIKNVDADDRDGDEGDDETVNALNDSLVLFSKSLNDSYDESSIVTLDNRSSLTFDTDDDDDDDDDDGDDDDEEETGESIIVKFINNSLNEGE